jgi:iron transport multicopper oxidase
LTNAAGNTDFLNLKGQNVQRPDVPSGFTKKGIIAMVFTCLSGILGLAALSAYGLIDIKNLEEKVARDLDIDELVFKDEEEEEESKKEANSNEGSSTTDRR